MALVKYSVFGDVENGSGSLRVGVGASFPVMNNVIPTRIQCEQYNSDGEAAAGSLLDQAGPMLLSSATTLPTASGCFSNFASRSTLGASSVPNLNTNGCSIQTGNISEAGLKMAQMGADCELSHTGAGRDQFDYRYLACQSANPIGDARADSSNRAIPGTTLVGSEGRASIHLSEPAPVGLNSSLFQQRHQQPNKNSSTIRCSPGGYSNGSLADKQSRHTNQANNSNESKFNAPHGVHSPLQIMNYFLLTWNGTQSAHDAINKLQVSRTSIKKEKKKNCSALDVRAPSLVLFCCANAVSGPRSS